MEPFESEQLQNNRNKCSSISVVFCHKPLDAKVWRGEMERCRSLNRPVTELCLIPQLNGVNWVQFRDYFFFQYFLKSNHAQSPTNQLPNNDLIFFFIFDTFFGCFQSFTVLDSSLLNLGLHLLLCIWRVYQCTLKICVSVNFRHYLNVLLVAEVL